VDFNFSGFIKDYIIPITLKRGGKGFVNGEYVDDGNSDEYITEIAVIHLTPEELNEYDGGFYTTQDLKLFVPEDNTGINVETDEEIALIPKEGDIINFQNNDFEVKDPQNNTHLSDFYKFLAKKEVVK
jgi:hypothetical protein